jgi:hypothetical protein
MINISLWLVIQDLYPARQIDVELSDNEPACDETEGKGVPSTELIAPNSIESIMTGETLPSAVSQIATASSCRGQKKKNILLATKCKQPTPSADQVTTHIELPLYHRP